MSTVLVIAPHPDDETLGCGGTLLRHRAEGDSIHWLIATRMDPQDGWPAERIKARAAELDKVQSHYGFASREEFSLVTTRVDQVPRGELVRAFADAYEKIKPEIIYLPFDGDAHSDHRHIAEAAVAASKWFRCPTLRQIFVYETLSETGFNLLAPVFAPNSYVDIAPYLDGKLAAMRLYDGEMGRFPFPRSEEAIRAQAALHGSACGKAAAEAFVLLRNIR